MVSGGINWMVGGVMGGAKSVVVVYIYMQLASCLLAHEWL